MLRDWAAIGAAIDRDLEEWTAQSLHETYLKHGCAIIRNGVDPSALAEIGKLAHSIYDRKPELHIYEPDFLEETDGKTSIYDLLSAPLYANALDVIYRGQRYGKFEGSCRRVSGIQHQTEWMSPLGVHLDCQVHSFAFTVNFWVPFQDSGRAVPGIQFVPIDYRTTRIFCNFTGHPKRDPVRWDANGYALNEHYFEDGALEPDRVQATFGDNCFIRPLIGRGDLVMLSNWIIHGTHRTPDMDYGRMNAELRFIGTSLDLSGPET